MDNIKLIDYVSDIVHRCSVDKQQAVSRFIEVISNEAPLQSHLQTNLEFVHYLHKSLELVPHTEANDYKYVSYLLRGILAEIEEGKDPILFLKSIVS